LTACHHQPLRLRPQYGVAPRVTSSVAGRIRSATMARTVQSSSRDRRFAPASRR
jgi:hypothetical protein